MGAGGSTASQRLEVGGENAATLTTDEPAQNTVRWKLMRSVSQAQKEFHGDGSLPVNATAQHIELRELLNNPVAQAEIGKYAKKIGSMEMFMCWIDIQDFKSIPTDDFRHSKALHIYHKYVKEGSVLEIGGIANEEREAMKEFIARAKDDHALLTPKLYDGIQVKCFISIYENIFTRFKFTEEYKGVVTRLKGMYNMVRVKDFDYIKKLGEGGFGLVLHVIKKSTGKHHAMKIQTKKGLLDCYSDDPARVDFEKQAFAACHHPFIVSLDYAFQNDALAFIVLDLATAGDLNQALKMNNGGLDTKRVQFYSAEIVLALAHLHGMGLMYRDLKPNNILLHEDGHIQLVDLGGVVDAEGNTLGPFFENEEMAPIFAPTRPTNNSKSKEILDATGSGGNKSEEPRRRMSIMGTFGYMAPEMVIMLTQTRHEKKGYSNSVDWWSLGATMFKLATGNRPFTEQSISQILNEELGLQRECREMTEYAILFQDIPFPADMDPALKDVISKLLDVNAETRLGAAGAMEIRTHPFYADVDWALLEQKHVVPPFIPNHKSLEEASQFPTFEALMTALNRQSWLTELPDPKLQRFFNAWDYVSPHTQRVELGVTQEMEQYDTNFKVRQLLGENSKSISVKRDKSKEFSRGMTTKF